MTAGTLGTFNVTVVGGGPAGATAALTLARAGRQVLLIDPDDRRRFARLGESLAPAAAPLLQALGVLANVNAAPHRQSYGNVSAWGSDALIATDFLDHPYGLGWLLDRRRFDRDLREAAALAGATLVRGWARHLRREHDSWCFEVSSGTSGSCDRFASRWLIDATGRGAVMARRQGAERSSDDQLRAVYTWYVAGKALRKDCDQRTLIEATSDGWWYTAPLPGGLQVVVLHVDADHADELCRLGWDVQLASTKHVRARLAGWRQCTPLRWRDAGGERLDTFGDETWLACGDAALAFDPLSSQGLVNALYSGMQAGAAVDRALAGDANSVSGYVTKLEAIRSVYLRQHHHFYAMETRWPQSPFWQSRQASEVLGAGADSISLQLF